jgi:hypothetical protein
MFFGPSLLLLLGVNKRSRGAGKPGLSAPGFHNSIALDRSERIAVAGLDARAVFLKSRGYPTTLAEARGWRLEHALTPTRELEELESIYAAAAEKDERAAAMLRRVQRWLDERRALDAGPI